jgi:hypothetical protein
MPFILRKEHPDAGYPTYVAVTPGFEDHVSPLSATYDPDRTRATRFPKREQAERWQAVLSGGVGVVAIEEA